MNTKFYKSQDSITSKVRPKSAVYSCVEAADYIPPSHKHYQSDRDADDDDEAQKQGPQKKGRNFLLQTR